MAACPSGHRNGDDQRFCGECGAPIRTASEPKAEASKAGFVITEDIELPGRAGILRRAKIIKADDQAPPTSPPGPPKPTPRVPKNLSSRSLWKSAAITGMAILATFAGCEAYLAVSERHDAQRASLGKLTSPQPETVAAPTLSAIPAQPSVMPMPTKRDPQTQLPSVGEPARDGNLVFAVEIITAKVWTQRPDGPKAPQGEYLVVAMAVRNIGSRSETYFADFQKLIDIYGRVFSTGADTMISEDDGRYLSTDINPGNATQVQLAFDVPIGTQPTHIVLHNSAASPGVSVDLTGHHCRGPGDLVISQYCVK